MGVSNRSAGFEGVLRQWVLERLERAGRRGLEPEKLTEALAAEAEPEAVRKALAELAADGRAVDWSRRWYAVEATDWVSGRIQLLERGDALIVGDSAGEPGLYVRARDLKGAGEGDVVLGRRLKPRGRRRGRLPEAAVVRVLGRRRRTLVGTLELGRARRWLVPFDPKESAEVEVEGGDELLETDYVVVEVAGERRHGPLRARVVEMLGDPEQPGVDAEVVLRHFEIPTEFPPPALAEAAALPEDPGGADFDGREDLRAATVVTIDGEDARDFDDAISVEPGERGGWRLGVHIADVAHYVPETGPLDLEAYRRGTSVYYPDRVVPMFPERLSAGLCSLRPERPRLTVSVFLDLDGDGEVRGHRFAETLIASARRLTYGEVRRLLEEPRPADREAYGEVLPMLGRARRLMERLRKRRTSRGSLDFDLPVGHLVLDPQGLTVDVRAAERNLAHRLIEEFMIAANEAVAAELAGHDLPALYRVHDPPDPDDLEELRQFLRPLGIDLAGDLESLHPSALQKVLRRVEDHPEEALVSTLVLRALRQALYSPECRGHYALASRRYTHFTSPIRRYPDLLVHRRLKALLAGRAAAGRESGPGAELLADRLPWIAERCSFTERRAESSERELRRWKLVRFLAARVGETFPGRITGVQPFGLFVELDEYFVDGLVPIRTMADDYYVYDPERHELVGQETERRFRLASPVEVVLTGVDDRRRSLELAVAGMPPPPERRRGRPRGLPGPERPEREGSSRSQVRGGGTGGHGPRRERTERGEAERGRSSRRRRGRDDRPGRGRGGPRRPHGRRH